MVRTWYREAPASWSNFLLLRDASELHGEELREAKKWLADCGDHTNVQATAGKPFVGDWIGQPLTLIAYVLYYSGPGY